MLVRCPWCQGTFETERYGKQPCTRCGAELDLEAPAAPPGSEPPSGLGWRPSADESWSIPPPPEPPRDPRGARSAGADDPSGKGGGGSTGGSSPGGGGGSYGGGSPGDGSYGGGPFGGDGGGSSGGGRPGGGGARAELNPWENRGGRDFFSALFATWKLACFRPTEFFSNLDPKGPIGPAFAYAVMANGIGSVFAMLWVFIQGPAFGQTANLPGSPIWLLLFAGVSAVIGIWISAAIIHVGCMVFGCGSRGFDATFRGVAYSAGPGIFMLVPFCGSVVASIWVVVLEVIAIQHVQQTSSGRAVAAIMLPVILGILCVCGVALLIFGTSFALLFNGLS